MPKCPWCLNKFSAYERYHDQEWGVPVFDDRKHFEFLILETAQAGLSWATILSKRDGYRKAFAEFDVDKVAQFQEDYINNLCKNPEIIRNKLKINAAVHNARLFMTIQKEIGSFSEYIWSFVGHSPVINHWEYQEDVPATSRESDKLSLDLKKRGFKFTGSTIMYAHMQACGLVNDHLTTCFRYRELM